MHELSFEEEYQEPGNNGLQIGLDATFGENNYQWSYLQFVIIL